MGKFWDLFKKNKKIEAIKKIYNNKYEYLETNLNECIKWRNHYRSEAEKWKNQAEALKKCSKFKKEYDPKWQEFSDQWHKDKTALEAEIYEYKAQLEMLQRKYDKVAEQNGKFKDASMIQWHKDKKYNELKGEIERLKGKYEGNYKYCEGKEVDIEVLSEDELHG